MKEPSMSSLSKVFTGMRVGQKLLAAFASVIVIFAVAIGFSLTTTAQNQAEVKNLLTVQARIADRSASARANTGDLRRFEKDMFLNDADLKTVTEYEAKWTDVEKALIASLDEIDKLVTAADDRATLDVMRKSLTTYETGLHGVLGLIRGGQIKDPASGNEAIKPYKD